VLVYKAAIFVKLWS